MPVVDQQLDLAAGGSRRFQLRWVSVAEGRLFADYVAELSDLIGKLGPFKPADFKLVPNPYAPNPYLSLLLIAILGD